MRKVAESSTECFIENNLLNVYGLILAGSADLKFELGESDLFDQRLRSKILKYVDISYGSYAGFNEAIDLANDCLKDVEFVIEKNIIDDFFNHIARETGLYCFGIDDTFKALRLYLFGKIYLLWDMSYSLEKKVKKLFIACQII